MANLTELRLELGAFATGKSDEDLLDALSKATSRPINEVADSYGYRPGKGSLTNERLSGSVDSYQANLYETGAAAARGLGLNGIANWAESGARDNKAEADVAAGRAKGLGGIDSYKDVTSLRSGANYLGGLAASSLPYAAEAVVGGVAGRAISGAAKAAQVATEALEVAKASGNVAEIANATAKVASATKLAELSGMAGATAASYPSAVGDILSNQREQNGKTDGAYAAVAGVPYALLNGALGIEGALGRGRLNPLREGSLDTLKTGGRTARVTAAAAKTGLEEGASELGQEFLNQGGRMAVDPNETFFNKKSNERFAESFVGGAAMGGAFGAVGNRGRRSDGYVAPQATSTDASIDTLTETKSPTLQLGYHYNTGVGDIITFPDGSSMLKAEYEAEVAAGRTPKGEVPFVPVAGSDMRVHQPAYMHEGGIDYQETPQSQGTARAPAGELQMPIGAPNTQADMFDPLMDQPNEQVQRAPAQPAPAPDTRTGDMFQQTPSAMAPTAFNPATEPSYNPSAERGAVAGNIRSQIAQQVGKDGDMALATSLSLNLADNLNSPQGMHAVIQMAQAEVEKKMTALEKKVSGGSNMLDPAEYERARSVLEKRQLTVMAAQELLARYIGSQTNAYAQEGLAKAQPGTTLGLSQDSTTASDMRQSNQAAEMSTKIADTDKAAMAAQEKRSAEDRDIILGDILASNRHAKKWPAFVAALKAAGYRNPTPTLAEIKKITAFHQLRADFRKGPVLSREDVVGEKPTAPREQKPTPAPEPKPVAEKKKATPDVRTTDERTERVAPGTEAARGDDRPGSAPAPVADRQSAEQQQPAPTNPTPKPDGPGSESAPAEPSSKRRSALSQEEKDTLADLESSVQVYNRPARDETKYSRDEQSKSAKSAAEFIYETANDPHESKVVRERAQALFDEHIDPRDVSEFAAETDSPKLRAPQAANPQAKANTENAAQLSAKDVQQVVDNTALGKLRVQGVQVMNSAAEAGVVSPVGEPIKGMTRADGTIVVFADAATSRLDVLRTVFHELFHRGVQGMFPSHEAYVKALLNLSAADPEVQRLAEEWTYSSDGQARRREYAGVGPLTGANLAAYNAHAVDEALAVIGERLHGDRSIGSKPLHSTLRNIARWMADLADSLGMGTLAQRIRGMTYNETEQFVSSTVGQAAKQDNAYGENYLLLAGKDVTIQMPVEGGKTAQMTFNAQQVLTAIDSRLGALDMVRRCLA